jgi:hypothetical protein
MQKGYDLLHRYSCSLTPSNNYVFTTSLGIEYSVAFSEANVHFLNYPGFIAEISFYPLQGNSMAFDNKIRNTIVYLIVQFLESNPENALIFICDVTDHKHVARNKLFQRWFYKFNKGSFQKFDSEIHITDQVVYYNSLIIHTGNPFKYQLLQSYAQALELYNK